MGVESIKKWTVILVFVGLIMSLGGSWAISQERARANEEDIDCVENDVEVLDNRSDAVVWDIAEINSSVEVMENDIAWIKNTLEHMNRDQ